MLAGCLTPHVKPAPSKAVAQAEAGAGKMASACPAGDLASISPVDVGFGFDEATVPEAGHRKLEAAARWLKCNPQAPVVIQPDADNHGDAAHLQDLAQRRAEAVSLELRQLGATASVIHMLKRGAADPVSGPHLVISATGRGW
jgi:outer membrane protein OmpA-like peptidoglycan-associated protein